MSTLRLAQLPKSSHRQRGAATLMVALVVLVILTVIVLASTNVALFEQRTATNENRQRLADQVAKYSLNLGGEFLKANIANVGSQELSGWLATNTSRWISCASVMDSTTKAAPDIDGAAHPCMAEPSAARRAEMYFYSIASPATGASIQIPYQSLLPTAAGKIDTVGGAAAFGSAAEVHALLCRIDTTLVFDDGDPATVDTLPAPDCRATPSPTSQNRIAVTIISRAEIPGESAAAQAKETWASFNSVASTSTVPLVASGAVSGSGNVTIVADPDGAGYGLPVSVWTAADADLDCAVGGCSDLSTCQLGDYLTGTDGKGLIAESELKTTCALNSKPCGCPTPKVDGSGFLSGKTTPASTTCCENIDILDVDTNYGSPKTIPDIQFFPGAGMDKLAVDTDDSLFEWVFGVANEAVSIKAGGDGKTEGGCPGPSNCAEWYLESADQLNAEKVSCAQLNAIGAEASGLYYVDPSQTDGLDCRIQNQIGSPESQAIVVLTDKTRLTGNVVFYGMLLLRSDNKDAQFFGGGGAMVFGSVVVEGTSDITGSLHIVYDPTVVGAPGKKLPRSTRLGRVAGSWLDNNRGGF